MNDENELTDAENEAYMRVVIDAMAFAMAASDPDFPERDKVERGEMPFPERYRTMATYALHALMDEGWGYVGQEDPLDS